MEKEPVIRPFCLEDKEKVIAFFDQMGGETRSFFDVASGNRNQALRYFEDPTESTVRRFAAMLDDHMVGYVFCGRLTP